MGDEFQEWPASLNGTSRLQVQSQKISNVTPARCFRPRKQFWEAIAEEIAVKPPRLRVPFHAHCVLAFLAERAVS